MPGTARVGNYSLECALPARRHELAFRASHVLLPRVVRLVILHPTHGTREAVARMLREACLVESLRHPGIPRLYECGRLSTGRPWLAYELALGPTLAETEPRTAIEALGIVCELAEILAYAHARGVVHGAVRPASIICGAEHLYLGDWSRSHEVEQDPRADVYALGVLAFELLAGAAPTGSIASLVDRMRAPEPAQRPTAADVVAEVTRSIEALEAIELALDGQTEPAIEDVVLVDIADPPPGPTAVRWTPPLGSHHPDTIPITNEPSRRR